MSISGASSLELDSTETYTVTLYDKVGQTHPFSGTVTMTLYGNPEASLVGSAQVSASDGVATFNLGISKAGTFHLYASVDGHDVQPMGLQVTVTSPSDPSSLVVQALTNLPIGSPFDVDVLLYNGDSEPFTGTKSITLSATGTLQGTLTASSSSGTASFTDIYFASAESNGSFTITATCTDCSSSITATLAVDASHRSNVEVTLSSSFPSAKSTESTYTFDLQLTQKPLANVAVAISSSDTSLVTIGSPTSLTFTPSNYDVTQTVTLNIVGGLTSANPLIETANIQHAISSGSDTEYNTNAQLVGCDQISTNDLIFQIINESFVQPYLIIAASQFHIEENQSGSYTVELSAAPSSTVTVTPTSSDLEITSSALSFNNGDYNTPKTVTYQGRVGLLGDERFGYFEITNVISTSDNLYEGAIAPSVSVLVVATSTPYLINQSNYVVMEESSSDSSYALSLMTAATQIVDIALSSDCASLSFSPSTVNISTGSTASEGVTITHTPDGNFYGMTYTCTIHHTVTSNDDNYDGSSNFSIAKDLELLLVNPCSYGESYDASTGACRNCPEGYACPNPGESTVCQLGEHSPDGDFICMPCSPGFECSSPTVPLSCSFGTYSLGGASSCATCDPGTACVLGNAPPAECPLGTYQNSSGGAFCDLHSGTVGFPDAAPASCSNGEIPSLMLSHCEKCPPGHMCTDPTDRSAITPCPLGTYSGGGTNTCQNCPNGSACSPFEVLGTCPTGYYSPLGKSSCIKCPAGSSCSSGTETACTGGTYNRGMSRCETCPAKYYCRDGLPPIMCPPGYISASGEVNCTVCASGTYESNNSCDPCPAGYFCPTPLSPPYPCPFGTYSTGSATECSACDNQYMCGVGSSSATQYPCPPGFSCDLVTTIHSSAIQARWPVPCPPGEKGSGGACSPCSAGFYCPQGTIDENQYPCPPGHYCGVNSAAPTACGDNTYNTNWKSTVIGDCLACPAGSYCLTGAINPYVCPPGHYCPGTSTLQACNAGKFYFGIRATAASACEDCPAGHYCPQGTAVPIPCPAGTYSNATGNDAVEDCGNCTAGMMCPIVATTAPYLKCLPGHFCAGGTIIPTDSEKCPAGGTNESQSAASNTDCTSGSCPAGWACPAGTNEAYQPKEPCAKGHYCSAGTSSTTQNPCPDGTYTDKNYLTADSECSECPAGYFCTSPAVTPTICTQGYYCEPSTAPLTNSERCPAGTYNPFEGLRYSGECLVCPKGFICSAGTTEPVACGSGSYNDEYGQSSCKTCSAGYYCPNNVNINQLPCGKGMFSSSGASSCNNCNRGQYCPSETTTAAQKNSNNCPAGLYCDLNTDHVPTNLYDRCPAGNYCTLAINNPSPCSAGTLRRIPGGAASSDCIDVEAGYYVSGTGQSEPSGECAPGYYCPAGGNTATPSATACPAGTVRTIGTATNSDDCGECPAGFYCGSATTTPTLCGVGNYCPAGSSTEQPCPAGTYNPGTGMIQESDCLDCPPGDYCATQGLSSTTGECSAGYFCEGKAINNQGGTATDSSPNDCPAGGYCPAGTAQVLPCPVGKYVTTTGNQNDSQCVDCPPGQYCVGASPTPQGDCAAGFFCDGGASTKTQHITPAGHFTGEGASAAQTCNAGTYNPAQGQSQCLQCPAGFKCPTTTMTEPVLCDTGKYCEAGTITPSDCPAGTYNPYEGMQSQSDCIPCKSGFSCPTAGLSAVGDPCEPGNWCLIGAPAKTFSTTTAGYGICPAGHYCLAQSSAPTPCPPGTFNGSTGQGLLSNCAACTAGRYCPGFGNTSDSLECGAGYYCPGSNSGPNPESTRCPAGSKCPQGSSNHALCVAGTYQPNPGQIDCIACPAGYYCEQGATDFKDTPCDEGYYCSGSTSLSNRVACGAGTYNPVKGATSVDFCLPCLAGQYCSGTARSAPNGNCNQGYYCSGSSDTATPTNAAIGGECTAGHYCPAGSSEPRICDAGKYCDTVQMHTPLNCDQGYYCGTSSTSATPADSASHGSCKAGYYCPAGSVTPTPCPAGTYNPSTLSIDSGACQTCDAGSYCSSIHLSAPTGLCGAGWFCEAGSKTQRPDEAGCEAGYECPEGSPAQVKCATGTYQSSILQDSCDSCPAGFYCNSDPSINPLPCPEGYFCPAGTADYTGNFCTPGTYNPVQYATSNVACLTCPSGNYCDGNANTGTLTICEAGYYCEAGIDSSNRNDCGVGNYCEQGSTEPTPCPGGYYCPGANDATFTTQCNAGYYCVGGSDTATPTDITSANVSSPPANAKGGICLAGYYCPIGSSFMTPCPIGKFSNAQGNQSDSDCGSCTQGSYCNELAATAVSGPCQAGFFCPTDSKAPNDPANICPVGNECPAASSAASPCPDGTYAPYQGHSSCTSCPAGFYCQGTDSSVYEPTKCPEGHYCTGGNKPPGSADSAPEPCPAGTYNLYQGQSACDTCPIGFQCGVGTVEPVQCPETYYCGGGTNVFFCPDGTFSQVKGLQRADNCKPCPVGKYCTSGAEIGDCLAGYYCVSGNSVNNPNGVDPSDPSATLNSANGPTSLVSGAVGYLCPLGHYCLVGTVMPTPCPDGKTSPKGSDAEADCTNCPAGYYCIAGDTNQYDCPPGSYCPEASEQPTDCPVGTYSPNMNESSSDACLPCPDGYTCDETGVGDYTRYPCKAGHYCVDGVATICPAGTWAPISATPSLEECWDCPSGSYCPSCTDCPQGSVTRTACTDWHWCDTKSSSEGVCPGGYYCHHEQKSLELCFAGYYCPEGATSSVSPPYRCGLGTYCPSGSAAPIDCPAGALYVEYSERKSKESSCINCPAGTYADRTDNTCKDCAAGYVCLEGASSPTPASSETEGGYPCPSGHYCPVGSAEGMKCPVGTYYKDTGAQEITDCVPCELDHYNDQEGQPACFPCGPSAFADRGKTTCSCFGENRSYMKRDGTCRCRPRYEFYKVGTEPSQIDSTDPCVPVVLDLCLQGTIRSSSGQCVDLSDCSNECQGSTGFRTPGMGICICDNSPSIDDVCDESCRSNTATVTLNTDGLMVINDPNYYTDVQEDFQSTPGYAGRIYCYQDLSCNVRTINLDGSGFTSDFQPNTITQNTVLGRRRLQTSSELVNPIICLQLGDTMIFDIDLPDHYPVYLKDSLLNSNEEFDYGPFLELEELVENSGQNITSYGYTFREAGRYAFADKSNLDNILLITVLETSQVCPDPYMRERAAFTLSSMDVAQQTDTTVDTDWRVYLFIVLVILVFLAFLSAIQVFRNRARVRQQNKMRQQAAQEMKKMNAEIKVEDYVLGDTPGARVHKTSALNPDVFQTMYNRLLDLNNMLKQRVGKQEDFERKQLQQMMANLQGLKDIILGRINPELVIREEVAEEDMGFEVAPVVVGPSFDTQKELDLKQYMDKIRNDPALSESQKQELIEELKENIANLDARLAEDRVKAEQTLKNRLDERSRRRKEMLQQRQQLEERERELREQMHREVKEAENIAQQAEKEFEKEKRNLREKEFGAAAKNIRKNLVERIRNNPDQEQEYLEIYEREMQDLENRLSGDKAKQHRELLSRLEARRRNRREIAQEKAQKAVDAHQKVADELGTLDEKLGMLKQLEEPVEVPPEELDASISEYELKSLDKKFNELQSQADVKFSTQQAQLNKQKQSLTASLSHATSSGERDSILENLRNVDNSLQGIRAAREAEQKRLLADRLKERRRLRKEKNARQDEVQKGRAADEQARKEAERSDERARGLMEFVKKLPENERVKTVQEMLADKHDQELLELQARQQQRASKLHASQLKENFENKAEALRAAPIHLSEMPEAQQTQIITSLIIDADQDAQRTFQQDWQEHQRKSHEELLKLLDAQNKEVQDTLKNLGVANQPEVKELNDEFNRRQLQMEKEAKERMDALERQHEDLSKLAKEKAEELAFELAEARRKAEMERARKELEDKQQQERDELARKGLLNKQQREQLIAQHQRELAQLEGSLSGEKERQQEILKKKLEEKRARRRKALQVPDDMKQFKVNTAKKLKVYRDAEHTEAVFNDDMLTELLRRIMRVEQILANADARQFQQVMKAVEHLHYQLSKLQG